MILYTCYLAQVSAANKTYNTIQLASISERQRASNTFLTLGSPKRNFPHKRLTPNCNGNDWSNIQYQVVHV